ncbi:MAG: hypothetical protein RH862_19420 [Leptospiraceae bacterium]
MIKKCVRYWGYFFLLLMVVSCTSERKTLRQIPTEKRPTLVFLDFENNSPGQPTHFASLRRAIPDLILSDFQTSGLFRVLRSSDRTRLVQELSYQHSGMTGPDPIKYGKQLNADLVLTGSFSTIDGVVSITARVTDVATGQVLASHTVAGPTRNVLLPGVSPLKQLSLTLLANLGTSLNNSEEEILADSFETREMSALLSNYEGEILMEKASAREEEDAATDLRKEARKEFEKAAQADPDYERPRRNLRRMAGFLTPPL